MEITSFEKKTRHLFHDIHKVQADNPYIFKRLAVMLQPDYLKVEPDFFHGKLCLDAGCGSTANATYNMLSLGAKKVVAFDLDETIFEKAPKCLKEFEGRYELKTDNVIKMSFADNTFDFTHCAGVLHHTSDVHAGIREIVRVTKPGGIVFIETYGKGGLVRDFTTLLRQKYENEESFKSVIDTLSPDFFRSLLGWLFIRMDENNDPFGKLGKKIPQDTIDTLFDDDLILTIKDRITAPVYHENSEDELRAWLTEAGCVQIERLLRYPYLKNLRRFICPLYETYDHPFAKLFYGDGNIQMKAIKP